MPPRKHIDLEKLENFCVLDPSAGEIAAYFGVHKNTIQRRMGEKKFREAHDKGVESGNTMLRQAQMKLARDGDKTMLIWLGKQRLSQKDEKMIKKDAHTTIEVVGLSDTMALAEEAAAQGNVVPLRKSGT
jgi:IS30 family transposase